MSSNFLGIIFGNFGKLDGVILAVAAINAIVYIVTNYYTNVLYKFFNYIDSSKHLPEQGKRNLEKSTKPKKTLTADELLESRTKMNMFYTLYINLTSSFPLLGMLGTVISLIPLVDSIGTINTANFFNALTSTFWGLIFAIIFKLLDSCISYKIDDNEKHCEHLLFPENYE